MCVKLLMCQFNMHIYLHMYKASGNYGYFKGAMLAKQIYEKMITQYNDLDETREIA